MEIKKAVTYVRPDPAAPSPPDITEEKRDHPPCKYLDLFKF